MTDSMHYVVVDRARGAVRAHYTIPSALFPADAVAEDAVIVVPIDQKPMAGDYRIQKKYRQHDVNVVPSLETAATQWRPEPPSDAVLFEARRSAAMLRLDTEASMRMTAIAGPLASIHAEKRRQAEAGAGPLVADEEERLAILAAAARQDEALAAVEAQRRAVKAKLRAAANDDELKAAMAFEPLR